MYLSCSAFGAEVDTVKITCLDQQEVLDDIYLVVRDGGGALIEFKSSDQKGMHRDNSLNMKNGSEFTLNSATLSKMSFNTNITIIIMEKDLGSKENPDDELGRITIKPNQSEDKEVSGGSGIRKFKYRIEWVSR
jgi:hypothetical protein